MNSVQSDDLKIHVDETRFPLVFVRFSESTSRVEIDRYYERLTRIAERGRFVVVADLSKAKIGKTPAAIRKHLTAASGRWDQLVGNRKLIGQAIVFRSQSARLLYTAYLWMRLGAYPSLVFESVESATVWARAELDKNL